MQEWGFLGVTFVSKWFKILLQSEFSKKSLTLKVCKPMKGMKVIWCHRIFLKSSIIVLDILLQWLAFFWNINDWTMWSVAYNLTKFLVYKPSQFHRFTQFRHFLHVVEKYVSWFFDMKFIHFNNFLNLKVNHMKFYLYS